MLLLSRFGGGFVETLELLRKFFGVPACLFLHRAPPRRRRRPRSLPWWATCILTSATSSGAVRLPLPLQAMTPRDAGTVSATLVTTTPFLLFALITPFVDVCCTILAPCPVSYAWKGPLLLSRPFLTFSSSTRRLVCWSWIALTNVYLPPFGAPAPTLATSTIPVTNDSPLPTSPTFL